MESKFNGDIVNWDVNSVTKMEYMFYKSEFTGDNGDISKWDVSKVNNMNSMFYESKFNNNISNWNIDKNCSTIDIFKNCTIKEEYKPKF
jgi:hypothetical protein